MKINPAAAFHAYKKINDYTPHSRHAESGPEEAAQKIENTDQIQISAAGARKIEGENFTRTVVSELHKPASPERLESLRSAIENKSYYVATDDLVSAIMRRWDMA